MDANPDGDGVIVREVPAGIGLFADGSGLSSDLDEAGLAAAAGSVVAERFGREVPVLYGFQVHGRTSFSYGAEKPLGAGPHKVGNCDALITAEPWVALCVRTADCLPVVLAADGVVAAIHAGWKGLAADVLGAVTRRFEAEYGVAAGRLHAVIGVGIGPCHYRVGPEVVSGLARHPCALTDWAMGDRVDLGRWARGRLQSLGLAPASVEVLPGCTSCLPRYHSYRRDGERAGRQWSAVLLTPG